MQMLPAEVRGSVFVTDPGHRSQRSVGRLL